MERDKRITIKDFYYFYPFKKNPPYEVNSNNRPQPFVKKVDETDEAYSMTYKKWKLIVDDYVELLKDYLMTGKQFDMPQMLGNLQLRKYKVFREIDWGETKKQGKKVYIREVDAVSILLKWYRSRPYCKFAFQASWKLRMGNKLGRMIFNAMNKDTNFANKILNT